jgi:aryl-alcohol dehydrogenase-like predicted oxidoreductase
MQQRRLGRTGLQVSILGVGGHTYPVGEGAADFCTPEARARLIRRLVDGGVTYFDTTWLNEVELLSDSFRRADVREPVVVSLQFVDGISDPHWRQKLRSELETRLRVMGYDRAPLFIMGVGNHRPPVSEIAAACEAMRALKEEGLIQNIGVSCHDLGAFEKIAAVIEASDLLDYMMIRYNWKFSQAAERLFPVAQAHDVGIVAMKVFCWDCGPDHWDRRISVFEPIRAEERVPRTTQLNAAQRSLLWCLQSAPCATTVPSINAMWEAEQLLQAIETAEPEIATDDFAVYRDRLDRAEQLSLMAAGAESAAIRERARALYERTADVR